MREYRAIRKRHTLLEICKTPKLAAEVTILAAENLGVDAAIIFADLLLPLEAMGLAFEFDAGEGPLVRNPIRGANEVQKLTSDQASDLRYVAESIRQVAKHFQDKLPVIGFCGAPFTLASYMIEGSGSRSYIETKKLMYQQPEVWRELMEKLIAVLSPYAGDQILAGADVFQIFDSWVGCLSLADYNTYVLPYVRRLVENIRDLGAPIIYFGTDTATLLAAAKETGADVIGIDWRVPLDKAWKIFDYRLAIQGNLDPATLLAPQRLIFERAQMVLDQAQGRAGHIFNLGHGILPETAVENVQALVNYVKENSVASRAIAG